MPSIAPACRLELGASAQAAGTAPTPSITARQARMSMAWLITDLPPATFVVARHRPGEWAVPSALVLELVVAGHRVVRRRTLTSKPNFPVLSSAYRRCPLG